MTPAPTYDVELAPRAARQLRALPPGIQAHVVDALAKLAGDPRPHGAILLTGPGKELRIRVRDYRIIYEIHDDVLLVLVVKIAHRREVYRNP